MTMLFIKNTSEIEKVINDINRKSINNSLSENKYEEDYHI